MENLKLMAFRAQLAQVIANNELPIGTTYYILKDIVAQIEKLYQETTDKEYKNFLEEQEKEKKKEKEIKPEDIAAATKGALVKWEEQDNQG